MDQLLIAVLLLAFWASSWRCVQGLGGPNVCSERQNYTITSRVKYQQPVNVRTYTWCLSIPPRCSSVHTEMREKWKVQTEYRSRLLQFCCAGFEESDERCLPKCPEGYTGNDCDEECPDDRWGRSCHLECRCPKNSDCDSKSGKCICDDGWIGAGCDVPADFTNRAPPARVTKPLFDWSTPLVRQPTRPRPPPSTTTNEPELSVISLQTKSTTTTFRSMMTTLRNIYTTYRPSTSTTLRVNPTVTPTSSSTTAATSTSTTMATSTVPDSSTEYVPTTTAETTTITTPMMTTVETTTSASTTTKATTKIPTTVPTTTTTAKTMNVSTTTASTPKRVEVTSQIESPVTTTSKPPLNATTKKDSPIIVILNKAPPKATVKAPVPKHKATESSIISLTVLKSTAATGGRKVKISLPNTTRSRSTTAKSSAEDDDDQSPTEEVKHVLTEPEQITSVAGDGEDEIDEEIRDKFYSALSVAMGACVALILVATLIVLAARCRRARDDAKMIELRRMMNGAGPEHQDELPSSYLRSVYHSPPMPEYPMASSSFLRDDKSRYPVPFMQPVVIHAISPIMMENFRDILESHYDHPKPPRPAAHVCPPLTTFGHGPPPGGAELPVTEEAVDELKRRSLMEREADPHYSRHRVGEEATAAEHEYDEIPWPEAPPPCEEALAVKDEAVTEL